MTSGFLMDRLRRNAFAHRALAGLCVSVLACLHAAAADATHVRTHRGTVQSAGVAEAHGRVLPEQATVIAASRRSSRRAKAVADEKKGGGKSGDSAKSPHAAKKNQRTQAPAKRGRAQKQLKVEDPLPMSQAALPGGRHRSMREEIASRRTAASLAVARPTTMARKQLTPGRATTATVKPPVATPTSANEPNKPVTVDDFVRAANGGVLPGEARGEGTAEASKPENDGHVDSADGRKNTPVANDGVSAPVKKPEVSAVAQRPDKNSSAAAGVAHADVSPADGPPTQRVVSGFGSEVDVLPGPVAARGGLSRKNAPPDELATHDRALQQQLADDAMVPVVVPLYSRSGRLLVPAPLKGTHEILVHQNAMADQEGLARIQDDDDLNQMRAAHLLLPLPESDALVVNDELPANRRCARPWTVKFVGDMARGFYAKFHEPLRLSSAVRTVDFQRKLQRVNGNAAALDGDTASPHLTGQAIDFGKSGMSRAEIAWVRAFLLPLINAGKIDVEEEFQQSCFHISVYASYAPKKAPLRRDVAMRQ